MSWYKDNKDAWREIIELILTDEIEASHIGCEYGEYDHGESY